MICFEFATWNTIINKAIEDICFSLPVDSPKSFFTVIKQKSMTKYMYISLVETIKSCFSLKEAYFCVSVQASLTKSSANHILNMTIWWQIFISDFLYYSRLCSIFNFLPLFVTVPFQLMFCSTSDHILLFYSS